MANERLGDYWFPGRFFGKMWKFHKDLKKELTLFGFISYNI